MQRLKNRAQYDAAMAGGSVIRTPHFVLHHAPLAAPPAATGPGSQRPEGLFGVGGQPWLGAVIPKRWARRAVTRNGIRRQIYAVGESFAPRLPAAAHVVRLRLDFPRADFPSAWSDALKASVRGELQQLFARAADRAERASPVVPAPAGTQDGGAR